MSMELVGGRGALIERSTLFGRSALVALVALSALEAPGTRSVAAPAPAAMAAAATTAPAAPGGPLVAPEMGSYDVGLMLGGQIEHNGLAQTVSVDALIRGLKDALGGRAVSGEERDAALRFMRDARDALAEKNRGLAKQFLERNAKEPGIVTMPSGLQYRVLTAGDASGGSPSPTDQVTVRYRASLADGTEFDRSDAHDRAATFRVSSVFKGWQQAFLAMKPGAKWQLFVPPELGYGNNSPPMVPPGALLIYDLELLRVEPGVPMDAPGKHSGPLVRPGSPPPH